MAPSNQSELVKMMKTSASIDNCPSAFRYPRGVGIINDLDGLDEIEIGKGYIDTEGDNVAILNLGTRLENIKMPVKF